MKKVIYYKKVNWDSSILDFIKILNKTNKKLLTKILFKIELLSKWNFEMMM